MFLNGGSMYGNLSQFVYRGKMIGISTGDCQNSSSVGGTDKFSSVIEQFEGIPFAGVMAGSDDDTSSGFLLNNHHFNGRGGA